MMGMSGIAIILLPLCFAIPIVVMYFVIKLAVKGAVRELKDEKIL